MTAADVAWTYNDIIKNDIANWTSYTTNIVKATAVGDSTVRIDCSSPQPALLANLAEVPILPEHVWAKIPTKTAVKTFAEHAADRRQRTLPVRRSGRSRTIS